MTIEEIIKSHLFKESVREKIHELWLQRAIRPQPQSGYYYKRDWYDRMSDSNNFNAEYFVLHYESILLRKSNLSSEIRRVIKYVCDPALRGIINELNQPKNEE